MTTAVELDFGSENTSPVHPEFVEALLRANDGYATNFEADRWTVRALDCLKAFFGTEELSVFTVSTGTAANAIAIGAMVPQYGSVLCHWDAHTLTDECGAPEMLSFGARQIPLPGEHGRLDPDALATYLHEARWGVVHAVQPSIVSLTNQTEAGTAYRPEEIARISAIARSAGLGVHMDGARFANAVAHLGVAPADLSWRAGVEVLTLGTTKSGSFGAEAIVAFTRKYDTALAFLRKRSGHFAPKSRFLSAQVEAYVDNNLWLRNAKHANRAAKRMADGLAAMDGVSLVHPTQGNEVFASMPAWMSEALERAGCRFQRDWRLHPRHNRFVASWATTDAEVDRMLEICRTASPGCVPSADSALRDPTT